MTLSLRGRFRWEGSAPSAVMAAPAAHVTSPPRPLWRGGAGQGASGHGQKAAAGASSSSWSGDVARRAEGRAGGVGEGAVPRPPPAGHQHPQLRGAPGGGGRPAAGLGEAAGAPPPLGPGPHSSDVGRGLQPGPADALLVPVAGPRLPRRRPLGDPLGPEEGRHRPGRGLAGAGRLVLPGDGVPRGADSGSQLAGSGGQLLGVLQDGLVYLATSTAGQLPLPSAKVPCDLYECHYTWLGYVPLLP